MKIPLMIPPSTTMTMPMAPRAFSEMEIFSFLVKWTSLLGKLCFLARKATIRMWASPSMTPGMIWPTNIAPTETDVRSANMTAGMEGGMMGPCKELVATKAAENSLL